MSGIGSIHRSPDIYSHQPAHGESKAAKGVHREQPEQRRIPGAWPESVGNEGAKGGFDAAAVASKLVRFLQRHGTADNQKLHGTDHGSVASGQPGAAHRIGEAVNAGGRMVTSAGSVVEAAKPLLQVAKAGRAAPLALVAVAVSMIPQLKSSLSEFVGASRDLLNAVGDKKPKETVPAYQPKLR